MSHEHGLSLDLFAARSTTITSEPFNSSAGGSQRLATATASGMPPEWGPFALDSAFASRKAVRKEIAQDEIPRLFRALWTFALARHEALLAMRPALDAAAALHGHRSRDDDLEQALKMIEAYRIEPADIPAARAFNVRLDLRPLAGEQPFPLPAESPQHSAAGDE